MAFLGKSKDWWLGKTPEQLAKRKANDEKYERRIQEIKERQKNREERTEGYKRMINTIRCPECQSEDVRLISSSRKEFSAGKAIIGGAVAGAPGLLAGAIGKKGKEVYFCNHCQKQFTR